MQLLNNLMKKTILLLMTFITLSCLSQNNSIKTELKNKDLPNISINFPKEIQVKNVNNQTESSLDKNMPWIVAFLIGLLSAGVNFWVAHRLRQSNEKNLQRQIESSNNIALTQFKTTIATKNRQDWINELRHELCDLLAAFTSSTGSDVTREELSKFMDRILYSKSKIQLLINNQKPEQKDLEDKIEALFNTYIEKKGKLENVEFATLRQAVINSGRKLFDLHWSKIKDLQ